MAQEIQPWRPSTTCSLEQRAAKSKEILRCATSPREAIEAAKKLVGQWPHARPADPDTYAASLAAVLAQYPLGLVQECVDPRVGLARTREFPPTVAALVEYCDRRLEYHQSMASYVPRLQKPARPEMPDNPIMAERALQLYAELTEHFRNSPESPLDRALREQAHKRRLRIEEVLRKAHEPAPCDDAPATAKAAE